MPFFKLTYIGPRKWNQTSVEIILAKDEKHALTFHKNPKHWIVENLKDTPEEFPLSILSLWHGD